jgi:glycosyltransferase involved in cell wall biosynthesis
VLGRVPDSHRAIVVDNGSADGSGEVAADLGAEVVIEIRRGYGAACAAGLAAATSDVVAFCDADGSLDPADLPAVTGPVEGGDADLVVGRRCPVTTGVWPIHAQLANRVLSRILRHRARVRLADLGAMRAGRRQPLLDLQIRDRRSGWPLELVLRASAEGWRITEVPVPYLPRVGRSKVTGTARGTLQAIRDMRRVLRELTG